MSGVKWLLQKEEDISYMEFQIGEHIKAVTELRKEIACTRIDMKPVYVPCA